MRKIIEAISILGGQEADEYLSFVAATHDDDEIRAEAAAARARLQRREAEAGTAARLDPSAAERARVRASLREAPWRARAAR